MQDRYVGDLGDFGKYGLLRALCAPRYGEPLLSLGVVWYLVADESHTNDGSRIGYLRLPPKRAAPFRDCDGVLYDRLQWLVTSGRRNVRAVAEAGVLPPSTVFFGERLTYTGSERDPEARRSWRAAWLLRAHEVTATSDLVFLDPDNGLGKSVPPYSKASVKYAYPAEVHQYLDRSQSVVVYHHIGRRGTAGEQISRQMRRLADSKQNGGKFAMLYHRGTARAFLVVESTRHHGLLLERAQQMISGPWSRHFDVLLADA